MNAPQPYRHLYVHLPFCRAKCAHCDFYSIAGSEPAVHLAYARALLAELDAEERPVRPETVYLGGGTPTHLSDEALELLLSGLEERFGLREKAEAGELEYTCEANPAGDLEGKFAILRRYSVNRISLGIQSFADDALDVLGRAHDAAAARLACRLARDAGFPAISLDLIFAHPGLDREAEVADLEEAIAFRPEHISAYALTVSAGTALSERARAGLRLQSEDEAGDRLLVTAERLKTVGYAHYEVSNYALPGSESRHNLAYWQRLPYLGIGAAAHSFDGRVRRLNAPDAEGYAAALLAGEAPPREEEELSREAVVVETVFLGLRTAAGLDLDDERLLTAGEREDFRHRAGALLAEGLARLDGDVLRLTERGFALADACVLEILAGE